MRKNALLLLHQRTEISEWEIKCQKHPASGRMTFHLKRRSKNPLTEFSGGLATPSVFSSRT